MITASNSFFQIKYVLLFISLILIQVLVCNNLLLFGVAVPFIYIYFIISLPLNLGGSLLMLTAFLMGFLVDLFGDTLGLNCMACLLLSVLKKPLFYAYMPKEDKFIDASPGNRSMGWPGYIKYTLTLSAIFCFLIFSIELFSFASFGRIVAMAASSTLFTLLLLIGVDALVD